MLPRKRQEKVNWILLLLLASILLACNPPGVNRVVELRAAIRSNDSNALSRFLVNSNAVNASLPLPAPGHFTFPVIIAAEIGNSKVLEAMIKAGANVNASNSRGRTALMEIMTSTQGPEHLECARLLLQVGANVNQKDRNNDDALSFAVLYRGPAFVKLLLDEAANPNASDIYGWTPLHCVRSVTNALLLLQAGAKVDATNGAGQTPFDAAVAEKRMEIADLLRSRTNEATN